MKYFIPLSSGLTQVSQKAYEVWEEEEITKYSLPDFYSSDGSRIDSIETSYSGMIEKGNTPKPFMLLIEECKLAIKANGQGINAYLLHQDYEYFSTFEALCKRRHELIQSFNASLY